MIVLDTSFLVSFFLSADINHKKALAMAQDNKEQEMLLSDVILYETLTVLNYKEGVVLCKEAYDELVSNRQVRIFNFTDHEKSEILEDFFNQKNKISLADTSVIYLAKKTGSGVLAFDKKIKKK